MKKGLPLLLLAFISIYSCKVQNKTTSANETVVNDGYRKLIKDKTLFGITTDQVPMDTAYITKDTLHIITKRIIGCDAGNFKLIWNGVKSKTLPVQTSVRLFEQVDAACKERHKFHLLFNLKPMNLKLDTTLINIGGLKQPVMFP